MVRVLCLDIEGGFGGSSRSLYELLRHMDRGLAQVEVWCRKEGPIRKKYAALGVPCRVTPAMPKISPLPTFTRNLYEHANFIGSWPASAGFREDLARAVNQRFDLVHFNHESLFALAAWLRPRAAVPFVMHIRTMCWEYGNWFARQHAHAISRALNHLVFITENERDSFHRLGGRGAGTVIYNVADAPPASAPPHPAIPLDRRMKIACLSNCAWVRGTDRLVEVAEALAACGRRDVLFVMAGNMTLERSLPGQLGEIGRRGGTLADYAKARGVDDMFLFLGHVPDPERVLAGCDALAKPTRENNPWGRDIIEALAAARPVFTVGQWTGLVQDGRTGVLQSVFDAGSLAGRIAELADHRDELRAMGAAAQTHVARVCHGPTRAAELLEVWRKQTGA
jgi:glycosyltransferase involved in cell wall biosynthesis